MGERVIRLRAIAMCDIRFNHCPVFEYNGDTDMFEMLDDSEFSYPPVCIVEDDDFIVAIVEGNELDPSDRVVKLVDKKDVYDVIASMDSR